MNKSCHKCNQQNPPEAAFCLNCASPLLQGQVNQQWNQPNFGAPQAGQNFSQPSPPSGGASQRAIVALVLVILGLVCCGPLTSLPAIIIGWMEMDAIKKGQSPQGGMWMASFGLWGGIIITVLQGGAFLLWLLLAAASNPYDY